MTIYEELYSIVSKKINTKDIWNYNTKYTDQNFHDC